MTSRHLLSAALCGALLLFGCGGSDDTSAPTAPTSKGTFTAVVSFGDSLSDVGTYAPATSVTGDGKPPFIGGRFTTNGPGATVWVEDLAAALGVTITPAEVGFNGTSVKCPAAAGNPSMGSTCTAYGQGGARITEAVGIGHNADGSGALTVPVGQQIANHLARFGAFTKNDLVLVYAGNNDVLYDFAAYALVSDDIQSQQAAGTLSAADAALQQAQAKQAAESDVAKAAGDLAADVKTRIVDKGALYIAVMTLSDIADTPFGHAFPDPLRAELTNLSVVFNNALREGLGQAPVKIIDTFPLFKEIYNNPGKAGFVNNTAPACDAAKITAITAGSIDDGSSLFCNDSPGAPYNGLATGADPITWQFADSLHPTTGGHRAIADAVRAQLQLFGWM